MARSIGDGIAATVGVRMGIEFPRKPAILADCTTIIITGRTIGSDRARERERARARCMGSCCYMSHI